MATKKKTSQPAGRAVDWSLVPRGAVSATVQTTVGLVAGTGTADLANVHPLWAAGTATVGALGHVAVSAQRHYPPAALLYRIGCWGLGGSWATWSLSEGEVWNPNGLAALVCGAVAGGVLAPLARARSRTPVKPAEKQKPGTAVVPRSPVVVEWEYRFRRVCRIRVMVTDVQRWDNGAGYDVVCVLPPGPATRSQIESFCEALAADARLPEGCGVEIKPGTHRGSFVAAVSTVNRLGEEVLPHPGDYSPRSILERIPLGERRDSSLAEVLLREDSVLITGRKGGGKTNLLDVLTLGIGRCTDALNWHIDMNGGGMSQAWLHAWLEGELDRPPIDWCAASPLEALLMTTVALAIAKDRKSSYRTYKMQANSKLLPVSESLPAIVLSIDEGAEVLSPTNNDALTRQVRNNFEEIQRIGRNEAVNAIVSSLRPTQDMISQALLKQSAIRMALYGLDAPDLGHLYNWAKGISMDDLPSKGCLFLGVGTEIRAAKAWLLDPAQITEAARAISEIRPDLDDAGVDVANAEYEISLGGRRVVMADIYAGRHDRMRSAFRGEPAALPVVAAAERTAPAAQPEAQTGGMATTLTLVRGGAATWPDPLDAKPAAAGRPRASEWPDPLPRRASGPAERSAAAPDARSAAAPPARREAVAAGELSAPSRAIPEPLARALAAFEAAGDTRMHSEALARAMGVANVWALADMLRPYGLTPSAQKFKRGGLEKRGYWRDDVVAAIERASGRETDATERRGEFPR